VRRKKPAASTLRRRRPRRHDISATAANPAHNESPWRGFFDAGGAQVWFALQHGVLCTISGVSRSFSWEWEGLWISSLRIGRFDSRSSFWVLFHPQECPRSPHKWRQIGRSGSRFRGVETPHRQVWFALQGIFTQVWFALRGENKQV
jgi:hypothetical protein